FWQRNQAPVAQLDRAPDYESGGQEFESLRARHQSSREFSEISSSVRFEDQMDLLRGFWLFMRVRKKFWLLPMLIMVAIFGGIIILTQGGAVTPFIYVF